MLGAEWARALAERHVATALPRRWAHIQSVAAQAESAAASVGDDAELLVRAAWLHDIGYAPDLVDTGFHPLDGARYLRSFGADDRLASLVAHHSCALVEAEMRGFADQLLSEFEREESPVADALVAAVRRTEVRRAV